MASSIAADRKGWAMQKSPSSGTFERIGKHPEEGDILSIRYEDEIEPIFILAVVDGDGNVLRDIASARWPRPLADYAFDKGALQVRHDYGVINGF